MPSVPEGLPEPNNDTGALGVEVGFCLVEPNKPIGACDWVALGPNSDTGWGNWPNNEGIGLALLELLELKKLAVGGLVVLFVGFIPDCPNMLQFSIK